MLGQINRGSEPEAVESWVREVDALPDELQGRAVDCGDIFEVAVDRWEDTGDWQWQITSAAMQFVREEPLVSRIEHAMANHVADVPGVTAIVREDTETWIVDGEPNGADLLRAAAEVIDMFAIEIADHLESLG